MIYLLSHGAPVVKFTHSVPVKYTDKVCKKSHKGNGSRLRQLKSRKIKVGRNPRTPNKGK